MERRFNGREPGEGRSTPSPKASRGRSNTFTDTSSESECEPETRRNRLLPTIHPRNKSDLGHKVSRFLWFNLRPVLLVPGSFLGSTQTRAHSPRKNDFSPNLMEESPRISPDRPSERGVPGGWFRTLEEPPRSNY